MGWRKVRAGMAHELAHELAHGLMAHTTILAPQDIKHQKPFKILTAGAALLPKPPALLPFKLQMRTITATAFNIIVNDNTIDLEQ